MGDRSRFKFLPAMLPMCCVIRATVKIITLFFVTSLNNRCILICFCCNNVSFVQLFICSFVFLSVCPSLFPHFCFFSATFHLFPLSFSLSVSFGEIFIFFLCLPLFLYVLSFFISVCLIFRLSLKSL